jgi:hypothetical protein
MSAQPPTELPPLQLRVRVPGSVLMRQVGDEMVMLNLDREKYYGLNLVGARLMQHAEDGATLEQIAMRLYEEFETEEAQVRADVRRVAAELLQAGLIEEAPAP